MRQPPVVERYLAELNRLLPGHGPKRRRLLREIEDHLEDAIATATAPETDNDAAAQTAIRDLGPALDIALTTADARGLREVAHPIATPRGLVEAEVLCSGTTHVIGVDGSALVLANHDTAAEAALAALGGVTPHCLDLLGAWRQPWQDALPLVPAWLDASLPSVQYRPDRGAPAQSTTRRIFAATFPDLAGALGSETRRRRTLISSLPYAMRMDYCSVVLGAAEEDAAHTNDSGLRDVARQLTRKAVGRIEGGPVPDRIVIGDLGSDPALHIDRGRLELTLPLTWPRLIAAAGIDVVDGRLVLAYDPASSRASMLDWHPGRRGWTAVAREVVISGFSRE